MSDKYETFETLKGRKILDIVEWFRFQDDKLHDFKQQWSDRGATDEKWFKSKELALKKEKELVDTWLYALGEDIAFRHNLNIKLVVSKKGEGA